MVKKINTLFLVLLFSIVGCKFIGPDWVFKEAKTQPESHKYILSKKPVCYSDRIDTNCVYVHSFKKYVAGDTTPWSELPTYYRFVQFASNGVCIKYERSVDFPFTDYNLNSNIEYCHYTFCNGTIKMEVFNYETNVFEFEYFSIQNDENLRLFLTSVRYSRFYYRHQRELFKKVCLDSLPSLIFPKGESISED